VVVGVMTGRWWGFVEGGIRRKREVILRHKRVRREVRKRG